MILSFKKQFAEPILNGSKIHTIRHDSKKRWNQGNKIHFATDVRTKNQVQFHESECVSVQSIEIVWWKGCGKYPSIYVDSRLLIEKEMFELSEKDGFSKIEDFLEWFSEDFKGKLIHWTNKKY